ncbi:MAG: hypothetical protein A3H94_03990 [Acidobacteria bacterium RIFCSPLOWO2_02_FULL_60_20]|nr:MAG: hypothetical protein A3H94_03990 [Acidobacteria bacterium RIFCSPLOWO2_02_FULL_60_20]
MALFKRGKLWWYEFHLNGTRIRESAGVATRPAASQKEVLRKAELLFGKVASTTGKTTPAFSEFAYGEFSVWCANEHKDRLSTYARYMRSIKALAEYFGNRSLADIDAGEVEKYKMHRSSQHRKNARDGRLVTSAAVNRDLAVLRILFSYAMRLKWTASNPVREIKFLREPVLHMRVLTVKEENEYLRSASPILRDVAILILDTGMRPGEVCALRRSDFDLEHRSVHVRAGKTVNARRFIPLTARASATLRERTSRVTSEWLFPCPFDSERPVLEVRKAHDAAVRRSHINPRFRLYDLRHTALSRMAMSGMDLATLKELAGHSQIQMTMRYVHPSPDHKRKAIDVFESFVDPH